jgi:hypothetical protein
MAPPVGTSPASGRLELLRGRFNGVKSQWEALLDLIVLGYKDAYDAHKTALKELQKAIDKNTESDAAALMFIFSLVSVGFAGGYVGGLIAPWVREAQNAKFLLAARTGQQEIAKSSAKELSSGVVKALQKTITGAPESHAYEPVAPDTLSTYLEKKLEFDGCFGRFNILVDDLETASDKEQWSMETGMEIFRVFLATSVFIDAPDPHKDLPDRKTVRKAAELLMWVQWAEVRDWPWWNGQYARLDSPPNPSDANTGEGAGFARIPLDQYAKAYNNAVDLDAILQELRILDKGREVEMVVPYPDDYNKKVSILDLRKLRKLKVPAMPDLPFASMRALDFGSQISLEVRGKFLDALSDLRPFFKK